MLWLTSLVFLILARAYAQQPTYGGTPAPFTRSSTTPFVPATLPPTIPPINPNLFPFAPTPRPIVPGFNNPYYNPAAGPAVPILSYSSEHNGDGSYSFSFSTADGKQAQETGYLKDAYIDNAGEPQGTQVVQGSYSYISPDGTPIQVSYIADENGFRPSGIHIPSDGKVLPPLTTGLPLSVAAAIADKKNPTRPFNNPLYNRYDPLYNRYDPYRRPFNNNYPYNRPYDPRYPYPYNPLNPAAPGYNPLPTYRPLTGVTKDAKEENKNTTA